MAAEFIPINLTEPNYLKITEYERNFDLTYWRNLFGDGGVWVASCYFSAIYVVCVFGGTVVMQNRQPFKLNGLLTIWNVVLAVMSVYAFSRCLPEFFHILTGTNGFHNSICEWKEHNHATAFWSFVLLLSKVFELGDTAFIVLRKQKLVFLHWYVPITFRAYYWQLIIHKKKDLKILPVAVILFVWGCDSYCRLPGDKVTCYRYHHITTLMSWWVMYSYYEPNQLWYIVMNSFVHSFMYTYYALRAMKIRVPKPIAMFITTIQLLQMVFGVIVNVYTIRTMYYNGTPADCPHRNWFGLWISFGIYVPYTALFVKLFLDSYVFKKAVKPKKAD